MKNRILSREVVLQSRVFDLERVLLREPDGSTRERHVVQHGGSVVVLPVLDDGRIVLIRNDRFALGKPLWELCAGTLEKDEEPSACAGRELIEETGYEAAHVQPLCGFYSCPGLCTEYLHAFVATGLQHVGQALDETEQIEVHIKSVDEVLAMIRDGEMVDAKSISAILYWHTFGG